MAKKDKKKRVVDAEGFLKGGPAPIGLEDPNIQKLEQELQRVASQWLRREGVTALDIGFKFVLRTKKKIKEEGWIDGRKDPDTGKHDETRPGILLDETGDPVLTVRAHVQRKISPEDLATLGRSGDKFSALGLIDVLEAEYRLESVSQVEIRRGPAAPLVGGLSVGCAQVAAGTLGAIVWDLTDGAPCLLGSRHVLGGLGRASVGQAIYQPGPADRACGQDVVARLKRWVLNERADAALAEIVAPVDYSTEILGIGQLRGTRDPALGQRVRKSGRTTGLTEAFVDGVHAIVPLRYGRTVNVLRGAIHLVPTRWRPEPLEPAAPLELVAFERTAVEQTVRFGGNPQRRYVSDPNSKLIRQVAFSDRLGEVSRAGDSGSMWVDTQTNEVVAMHVAGNGRDLIASEFGIATPIHAVMRELGFSFAPVFRPQEQVRSVRDRQGRRVAQWLAARPSVGRSGRRSPSDGDSRAEPLRDPVTEPLRDPVTEPLRDPLTEPLRDPVTEPLRDPVTESLEDPLTE